MARDWREIQDKTTTRSTVKRSKIGMRRMEKGKEHEHPLE
jgi:hypothetical protein